MLHARIHDSLTPSAPSASGVGVWQLIGHTPTPDTVRDAFAWVIATYCAPNSSPFVPALGLEMPDFMDVLHTYFPKFSPPADWLAAQSKTVASGGVLDEFPDLLQLLLENRGAANEHHHRLAHLVATACMGENHLWQDLGLPDREALSTLLSRHFPTLAAKNDKNMKWKKFFYRQLCERDGYVACNRPSCAACSDYDKCFGPEE